MTTKATYDPYVAYETDKRRLQTALVRYLSAWKWFAAALVLALGAGVLYVSTLAPIYSIQASVLLNDEKKGAVDEGPLKEQQAFVPKKVTENEIEVLRSYSLMSKVVDQLGLNVQYVRRKGLRNAELFDQSPIRVVVEQPTDALYEKPLAVTFVNAKTVALNGQPYSVNQTIATPYGRLRVVTRQAISPKTEPLTVHVVAQNELVDTYLQKLQVEPSSKLSTVVVLSFEDAVPRRGEAILNSLIELYSQAAVSDKNQRATGALDFIENRLKLISGELSAVEQGVETYKSAQGITDLSAQAQSFLQTVQQNDAQLNQVNVQLSALEDVEDYVRSKAGERGVVPATVGLGDPVLLSLVTKVNELELQRDQLVQTTSEQNPLIESLDGQIKATKASIRENIQTMKAQLSSTRDQLAQTNQKLENEIRTVPNKERELLKISRQQAVKNDLYNYLLQKREETAIATAAAVSDSRVVDPAHSSAKPVKPQKKLIVLLFGLFGLVLPAGVLMLRDVLNTRIVRRTDVEDVTEVPILGEVVRSETNDALVVSADSHSLVTEQIRMLRTNLHYLRGSAKGGRVLLLTSSISGEGKSFLSMNLGASLAMVDQPTVILEMDLRKPRLHQALHIDNAVGISDYLSGRATLADVVKAIPGHPNYFIITSGPLPTNPAELLSGPRMAQLMQQLRKQFHYVVLDTPPIGFVTDAKVLAPFADTTLFVVRFDLTPKTHLRLLDELHREQRFQQLNVVLNGVDVSETYSSGYAGYIAETEKPHRRALRRAGWSLQKIS